MGPQEAGQRCSLAPRLSGLPCSNDASWGLMRHLHRRAWSESLETQVGLGVPQKLLGARGRVVPPWERSQWPPEYLKGL